MAVLSESTKELAGREPRIPPSLAAACAAVEGFGAASFAIPDWLFTLKLERFPAACLRLAAPFLPGPIAMVETRIGAIFARSPGAPSDARSMVNMLANSMAKRIFPCFLRTIALEVTIARVAGQLDAATSEGRFDQFIGQLVRPERLKAFYREYPVLARQVVQVVEFWMEEAVEMASRLALDWPLILREGLMENGCGKLTELESGAGDGHKRGRSVVKLKFESGARLIYKPRSLALDEHFEQLVMWLNERLARDAPGFPELRAVRVIERGTHGWSQFVLPFDCSSAAQVDRFYLRQGGFLALLHLIEATDFHSENLIASGEHPVLVDLEALFKPRVELPDASSDPAESAWLDSVMMTGLLPERSNPHGNNPGYDISGLGHRPGERLARPEAIMVGLATDAMHLTQETGEIPVDPNAPTLNGKRVDPFPMLEKVCEGFMIVGKLLIAHRDQFIAGPLERFRKDETRFIMWPTQVYDLALRISFHPDYLRDALDRERVFNRLWRVGPKGDWDHLVRAERLDLLNRDIPYFSAIAGERDVLDRKSVV